MGGLDLTKLQPRYLLTAMMQAAELTDSSTRALRIHPVNNTCTASVVIQEDALKLVQLHQITYEQYEYAMMAYIVPPMARSEALLQTLTGKNRRNNYSRT
ncbi:hypothetical protein MRX96_028876 [Rhipicephalus microplus]